MRTAQRQVLTPDEENEIYDEIRTADPYYAGLDNATIERFEGGNVTDTECMIFDLERGMKVIIGFCERQKENNAQTLRNFIVQHPQFTSLIEPILAEDPEYGGGEIYFQKSGDHVDVVIKPIALYQDQMETEINTTLSLELYREFVRLSEPFACFMTQDGYRPLNF